MAKLTQPEDFAREKRALELRIGRMPFAAIAEEIGYADASGAYKAVQRALRRTLQEPAAELRRVELESLDQLYRAALIVALQPGDRQLEAQRNCLKIMERRARLLGLDAPQRKIVDVISRDAFEELRSEMEAELAELTAVIEAGDQPEED
jgi:hypothetical protein